MRLRPLALAVSAVCLLWAGETVAPLGKFTPAERRHWAFTPRSNPSIPAFTTPAAQAWAKAPIDAFVLEKLQASGMKPSPKADPATLVRRLYFDLTGLPPTPDQVKEFVANPSSAAWDQLVNRLLDSRQYGERWAQHWLDVARFAETDGFEYDTHRNDAWRYRDYVIRAFQNDKPYDRFLAEQLAGDEIGPQEDETLIAAGFNRLGPLRKNAGNQEVASSRNEVLTEMTNAVGSAILGVTLGCARCHDHKFDPIRQSDYYRIQAYFAGVWEHDVPKATPEERQAWDAEVKPLQDEMKQIRAAMKKMTPDQKADAAKKLEEIQDRMPAPLPALFSVDYEPEKKSEIHLLARGDYQAKGDRVGMRPLGVLMPDNAPELPADTLKPRSELVKWIVDPHNPLTARVMVNRIWHYHFGQGIVATPNDFGRMGSRPTHRELLDYLANEFVASGYSVKHIHRLILSSNAWQQASDTVNAAAEQKDPENKLIWKFSRRRLDAEEIRDAMLAVSGSLNLKAGGPSVIVPIEEELVQALYKPSQWAVTKDPGEHSRRTVYLIAKRNLRLPFTEVFDAPDLQVSCPKRESSTHAPQALELLNGRMANRQAEAFAQRLEKEAGADVRMQIDRAFRLATGRAPSTAEMKAALDYRKRSGSSLREFALVMFNLNAFLYVN